MKIATVFIFFLLTGCTTAQMLSSPNSGSSEFAPMNESSRTGTIKYLNQGASFVIIGRREDAYRQMYEACKGKYKIESEGPRSEGGVATPVGNQAFYSSSEYWYITFKCIE